MAGQLAESVSQDLRTHTDSQDTSEEKGESTSHFSSFFSLNLLSPQPIFLMLHRCYKNMIRDPHIL